MSSANILFPNQLFYTHPLLHQKGSLFLVEEFLYFQQYPFHKIKLAFHRASMKYYQQFLHQQGPGCRYIEALEPESDVRNLIPYLYARGIRAVNIIDPVDDWLTRRLRKACKEYQIELTILDSPLFLHTNQDISTFFKPEKKKFFQTEFYKKERIRHKLLLDDQGGPLGGQWTYDTENRKKYPKGKQTPSIPWPKKNAIQEEAMAYVQAHFPQAIGTANELINYPTDHESSTLWLRNFLAQRLSEFGDYEDAILQHENLLHHSLLTPMLNVGLLTPKQVLEETLRYSQTHQVPLNSLEGFIRQIIGWREFIRGVYVAKGREERVSNFWGFKRRLPNSFYTGRTGILPVDRTIQKVLQTGYCHHIERLMILGNFMLLCEFHPDEVYRWFMEHFIDAYDWVMVPNVYGMSQFADGGLLSTKPYISGSNYLMSMSDFPKGDWQVIWDALFWRFLHRHRDFFQKHPRLGMLLKTWDTWDAAKRETLLLRAEHYLQSLDEQVEES